MLYLRQCLSTSAIALLLVFLAVSGFAQRTAEYRSIDRSDVQALAPAPQLVQLDFPLSAAAATRLTAEGVKVLHHYGQGRYLLSAKPSFGQAVDAGTAPAFAKTKTISAFDVLPELRQALEASGESDAVGFSSTHGKPKIQQAERPAELFAVELVLAFPGAEAYLREVLAKAAFQTDELQFLDGVTLRGRVTAAGLRDILAHPYLLDASPVLAEAVPYSDFPLWEHRATVLNNAAPGGLNLNGEGVVIGIGDGGKLSGHPDVAGRIVYSTNYYSSGWGTHPDLVTSLAGGAGTLNPRYRGTASKARFVIDNTSAITYLSPYHFEDYGMTITNNSYGPPFDCASANRYYGSSASIDQQLHSNSKITHVFASGNSGDNSCDGEVSPYSRIPAGAQCAKNTLTVGNANAARQRFSSSSCGPTFDGRLKPEIIAIGTAVIGNDRSNGYTSGTGTSLSTPAVVGMLALFTEHYKKLHHDSLPDGALLKAIACNTADEMGRPGPDFENGFGMISGTGGVRTLTQGDHAQDTISVGIDYRRALSVAAGTEQLKVLLYWHDRPGETNTAGSTLVDDLDLYLLTPAGDTLRPWVLDALHPTTLAVRGRDSLNNIEQVTLMAPAAGIYTLVVRGRRQPFGKTPFALTWAGLGPDVQIVQPVGGDSFDPSVGIPIAWESSPGQTGEWRLEYAEATASANPNPKTAAARGAWQTIHAGLPTATHLYNWMPPAGHAQYVFRVTNLATGLSHEVAAPVTAFSTPAALRSSDVCAGRMRLDWQPVPAAVGYEVFAFDGTEMAPVSVVTDTEVVIDGLTENQQTYFSVAAIDAAGNKSVRAVGLASTPAPGGSNCSAPLPVEWTSIDATDLPLGVRISWGIAQERQTDHFEVQRSLSGSAAGDWVAVGTVDARGYATSPAVYTLDDERVVDGETYYYRVRQFDLGGTFEDSEVVVHRRAERGLAGELFAVAQNPVGAELGVNYRSKADGQLDIYDLAGRRLAALPVHPGVNRLAWPAGVASGIYLLRVADGSQVQTLRVVKG